MKSCESTRAHGIDEEKCEEEDPEKLESPVNLHGTCLKEMHNLSAQSKV